MIMIFIQNLKAASRMDWVTWTIDCSLLYLPILYDSSGCVHWTMVDSNKGRLMDSSINAVTLLEADYWTNKFIVSDKYKTKQTKVEGFLNNFLNHLVLQQNAERWHEHVQIPEQFLYICSMTSSLSGCGRCD